MNYDLGWDMTVHNVSCGPNDWRIQYTSGDWTNLTTSFLAVDQATVTFDFNGTFVSVLGSLDSNAGKESGSPTLTYILDGETVDFDQARSSAGTLYSSPSLLEGPHTLQMASANNDIRLSIEGMVFTAEDSTSNTDKARIGEIVGGTLGGVVLMAVIILAVVLYRRRGSRSTLTFSDGPLQAALPASKEAFTSRNYSNYGISFYPTNSSDTLTRLPLTRTGARRDTSEWLGFKK